MRNQLSAIGVFLGVIWVVFLLQHVPLPVNLESFGLRPRTLLGLTGIAAMPFLHEGLAHLLGNTISLGILLVLLAGSRRQPWKVVLMVGLCGGALLWLLGRGGTRVHIGASLLVFGLMTFLILVGFLEWKPVSLGISLLVGFLYGGTLVWGILPLAGGNISWDGHLCGVLAGCLVAFALTAPPRRSPGAASPANDDPLQISRS